MNYHILFSEREGDYNSIDPKIRKAVGKLYDSKEFKTIYSLNNLKPDYFEKGAVTFCADPFGEDDDYQAISTRDAIELKAAMEKDFQELSYDKVMRCSGIIDITCKNDPNTDTAEGDSLTEVLDLPISKNAKNTRAWLKEHDFIVK